MDDDLEENDEELKKEIEAEIRRRKRAIAKARKEDEDRMLIEAAEGKVGFTCQTTATNFYLQGLEKRRKRHSKTLVSICQIFISIH